MPSSWFCSLLRAARPAAAAATVLDERPPPGRGARQPAGPDRPRPRPRRPSTTSPAIDRGCASPSASPARSRDSWPRRTAPPSARAAISSWRTRFNHRVQAFDLSATLEGWPGRLLRTWGGFGSGPGDFDAPQAGTGAAAARGEAEARLRRGHAQPPRPGLRPRRRADRSRHRRPRRRGRDSSTRRPASRSTPTGTRLFVTESGNRRVSVFSADTGAFLFAFGADVLRSPAGIAADSRGDLLVTDVGTRLVHRFRPEPAGAPRGARQVGTWGRSGGGDGEWIYPQAIAIDARDRVYVADLASRRCQVFRRGRHVPRSVRRGPDARLPEGRAARPRRRRARRRARSAATAAATTCACARPSPFPRTRCSRSTAEVEEGCDPPRRPAPPRLRVDGGHAGAPARHEHRRRS